MGPLIDRIKRGLENFGLYYSKYPGVVIRHHGTNPNKLILKVPSVWGDIVPSTIFAQPQGVMSGNNYGIMMTPQPGEMVWVTFRNGNRNFPIWSFMGHSESEKPKEYLNPSIYGFKTPGGSILYIDDSENTLKLKIVDVLDENDEVEKPGPEILIDNDVVSITHWDSKITLDKEKSELETFGSKLTITEDSASLKLRESVKLKIENGNQNMYQALSDIIGNLQDLLVDVPNGVGTMNQATKTALDLSLTKLNKIIE